jgi:hypothetical protein
VITAGVHRALPGQQLSHVLSRRYGLGLGKRVLPRTTPGPLAGDHLALDQQLATPNAPRLTPFQGCFETGFLDRAFPAQCLGVLHISRLLGEEHLRVDESARQLLDDDGSPNGVPNGRREPLGCQGLVTSCVKHVGQLLF